MTGKGRGSQIIQLTRDHKYILDENELKQVLLNDEVKDLPVAVVSVAGYFRSGRSFLLNFFLRYLSSPPSARTDGSWLGKAGEPLFGFSWRGGSRRETTGILIWSELFIVTLPSGVKVAVLLMDLQGILEKTITARNNCTIYALSTLLSSVQIYNLSQNIKEDDLQWLELFMEYGISMKTQSCEKALQELKFIVRDWQFPSEYPYGTEGGEKLLEDRFRVDPNMSKELKELRTHIRSSFSKISGYLMPHPGIKVLNPAYKGNVEDIFQEFRSHLLQLVPSIFGSDKLQPKLINGEMVKARELYTYIKIYLDLFNSDNIPTPKSIMEMTVKGVLLNAYYEGLAHYENDMERDCGQQALGVPAADLTVLHDRYKGIALSQFAFKKKMGSSKEVNQYYKKLSEDIDSRLQKFVAIKNIKQEHAIESAKAAYDAEVSKVINGNVLCVHRTDLEVIHDVTTKAALKVFDAVSKKITDKPNPSRDQLKQSAILNKTDPVIGSSGYNYVPNQDPTMNNTTVLVAQNTENLTKKILDSLTQVLANQNQILQILKDNFKKTKA